MVEPQWLADSAVIADAVIDPQDQVPHCLYDHLKILAIFRPVFITVNATIKGTWSKPIALYLSPYLRHLADQWQIFRLQVITHLLLLNSM